MLTYTEVVLTLTVLKVAPPDSSQSACTPAKEHPCTSVQFLLVALYTSYTILKYIEYIDKMHKHIVTTIDSTLSKSKRLILQCGNLPMVPPCIPNHF